MFRVFFRINFIFNVKPFFLGCSLPLFLLRYFGGGFFECSTISFAIASKIVPYFVFSSTNILKTEPDYLRYTLKPLL